MSNRRLLSSVLLLVELAILTPFAYQKLKIERHPLDQGDRLPGLLETSRAQRGDREQFNQDHLWEWSSSVEFDIKYLVNGTQADLAGWRMLNRKFEYAVSPIAGQAYLPVVFKSSVVFHANLDLLTPGKRITRNTIRENLQTVIDEAQVAAGTTVEERSVDLVVIQDASISSEYQFYTIPDWGVVSVAADWGKTLSILVEYSKRHVFSERNKRLALESGISSILNKLVATKSLADSLPGLPVVKQVAEPFEECLELIQQVFTSLSNNDESEATRLARRASKLASQISAHPSLISEVYISSWDLFAIFAPLILPSFVPLLQGFVRELRAWRLKGVVHASTQ